MELTELLKLQGAWLGGADKCAPAMPGSMGGRRHRLYVYTGVHHTVSVHLYPARPGVKLNEVTCQRPSFTSTSENALFLQHRLCAMPICQRQLQLSTYSLTFCQGNATKADGHPCIFNWGSRFKSTIVNANWETTPIDVGPNIADLMGTNSGSRSAHGR